MARKFNLESRIKSVNETGDVLKIVGYASTSDTDRTGDVIVPDAWTKGGLENYQKNPIILFNHNYNQPIGRSVSLEVDAQGLKIECEISKSAENVYGLIKDGVLSTFSVGFMIRDADYNQTTDGYIIRDVELLEVSVVSVPCNQAATFSISKSFENLEELAKFNNEINTMKGQNDSAGKETKVSESEIDSLKSNAEKNASTMENRKMNEEEVKALAEKLFKEKMVEAEKAAAEKAAAEKAAAEKAAAESETTKTAVSVAVKSVEERLLTEFDTKLKANNENLEKTFNEMKEVLESKNAELKAFTESKRMFSDKGGSDPFKNESLMKDAEDAYILGRVTRKGNIESTKYGQSVMEKINLHSTVNVGVDRLETEVSTNIERDIWNSLILAPLFREINMTAAQMTFPIMPDAGYAEITTATTAAGTQPNGNVDARGAAFGAPYAGITLTEKTLNTVKMISKAYLGNETEEDAILPILPLIRESMQRTHARGVENMLLAGNTNQGVYTSGAAKGLLNFASTASRTVTAAALTTKLTGAGLFGLRKTMGKYGLDPRDVVYIVSQDAYFQLIEDPEFADADLVGMQNANKLTGEVGRLYGSQVIMCDEFAPAGANNYFALAVNRRNFLIPRLRGMTVESEYQVEEQRTVLVSSQRLGFDEIIPDAKSVVGLKFPAS